jgi:hypothetical protein
MAGALTLTRFAMKNERSNGSSLSYLQAAMPPVARVGVAGETLNFETALNPNGLRRHTSREPSMSTTSKSIVSQQGTPLFLKPTPSIRASPT